MKNKISFIVWLIVFSSVGCVTNNNCATRNPDNEKAFKLSFRVLKNQHIGKKTYVADYRNAVGLISHVTGIPLHCDMSHTIGYKNDAEYKEDVNQINSWYKNNYCNSMNWHMPERSVE